MEGFSFENQGTNTYLVYTVSTEDCVDSMSLGMLTNNKIPGLAPAIFTQMDTTKYIKYNVSAHISVKQFFSGPVNKKRLVGVFNGIVDAMLSAEDYMIDVNSIIMDLDYIFADVSTCETVLICLPIANTEMPPVDLGVFFKNIMFGTQFDQTENCDHVAKIMNYLNSTPVFSLSDFKELLNGIDTTSNSQPVVNKPQPVVTPPVKPAQEVKQPVQPAKEETAKPIQPVQPVVSKPATVQTPPAAPVKPVQTPPAKPATPEKKISMFSLLMHYSKENAALYKAQKEASKNAAPAQPVAPATAKPATPQTNPGFAVPGQSAPANTGFAIPGQPAQPVAPTTKAPATASASTQPATPVAPVATKPNYQPPVVPQSQSMNFGETTVLGGGNVGETTVLGAAPTAVQPKPYLVRVKNNEKINLDKPVYRIGKEKSYVDYFIGDNTAISRSHANFITREDQYFVLDTNSTNHTYVNGTMIQSGVETQIFHGDKVRLANEDFEFKLY